MNRASFALVAMLALCLSALAGKARADNPLVPVYQKLCDGGDASYCQALGNIYNEGRDGAPVDKAKATALFVKACNGGADVACRYAADLYAKGDGVTKDGAKAATLYKRGCDLNDKDSCARLAQGAPQAPAAPAATSARTASAPPVGPEMRYKAQNNCKGGVDSTECVSCEFHDCKIGGASGILKTGETIVTTAGGANVKITTLPNNYLSTITHFEPGDYAAIYGTFAQDDGAKANTCVVDIMDTGELVSPNDARAYIEAPPGAKLGRELDLKLFQLGSYEGSEELFVHDQTKRFTLEWHVLYKTVEIFKDCYYKAQPNFSEPHYAGIAVSIDIPDRPSPQRPVTGAAAPAPSSAAPAQPQADLPKDPKEVMALAEKGNAAAQARVGFWYQIGAFGFAKDEAKAIAWYTKSASQNYASGMYNLCRVYDKRLGITQGLYTPKGTLITPLPPVAGPSAEIAAAVSWCKKANATNGSAYEELGALYARGWPGTAPNYAEAYRLLSGGTTILTDKDLKEVVGRKLAPAQRQAIDDAHKTCWGDPKCDPRLLQPHG